MTSARKSMHFGRIGLLFLLLTIGCRNVPTTRYLTQSSLENHTLDEETLRLNASAGPLTFDNAQVITDNDESFENKLDLIRNSTHSLDLAYYIFASDYSSSLIAQELIHAAQRGVQVRILVDYFSGYNNLDFFSMLERYGNQGTGRLSVRFYNRPTDIILKDAVYATLGCEEVNSKGELHGCSEKKFAAIESRYQEYLSALPTTASDVPSNFSSGWSSLFLSGLYSKDPELMAFAIVNGQQIDLSALKEKADAKPESPEDKAEAPSTLLKAGTIYWKSRATNDDVFERVAANIKLSFAFMLFGTKLNPMYDTITAYLPIGKRTDVKGAIRDWDFLTEFSHHKFLLADDRHLLIGGRNIQDSYHMAKNPFVDRYVFMDTDLRIDLKQATPSLSSAFERLWNFRTMVADLRDIREHAPNDFLQAKKRVKEKCRVGLNDNVPTHSKPCVNAEFARGLDENARIDDIHRTMRANVKTYQEQYTPPLPLKRSPTFPVDEQAKLYYLENLPFERTPLSGNSVRKYGAINGLEGESGKYLHAAWLAGLRNACAVATENQPQEVILHNAYFFLPSNLLRQLGEMIDGTLNCRHVRITIITNSEDTTDLKIVNLAARASMKAFAEFYQTKRNTKRGATFRAFIYKKQGTNEKSDVSLHSKVSVLGPDIIIGSANADVRSYILDSNNGVLIRNAPLLHASYCAWVEKTISDPMLTTDAWPLLTEIPVDELIRRDSEQAFNAFRKLTGKSPGEPDGPFLTLMRDVLLEDYKLSKDILGAGWHQRKAEERFNSVFKLL